MTSNLINFVVDHFLSKFIEIDKSQTYASLWSGVLELKNVKIKKECFNYINLPYFILEKGFIGKIKIELNIPFFYNNPINIYINDIFILSKQKDINHLDESEEIKTMKDLKTKKLISDEEIFNKIEELESQEPSFITQIIKNINININNIILRFVDSISNPSKPFSFGLILKNLIFKSSNEECELLNNDIIQKTIFINDLCIYIDSANSLEDLDYNKLINISIKDNISSDMNKYLDEVLNFYCYCQSELNIYSSNELIHDYIIYKLNIEINLSMNNNLQNYKPKFELYINEIDNFILKLNMNQLSNIFLLLSYYNFYNYYQLGLSKVLFNKKIEEKEKIRYIFDYLNFYHQKYKNKSIENKNDNIKYYFQEIDEKLSYEQIKELRKVATNNLYLYSKQKEIEAKINDENNKWLLSPDNNKINNLNEELKNIKIKLKENIKYEQNDLYNDLFNERENDEFSNFPNDFIFFIIKINIKEFHFEILEDYSNENNNTDILLKKFNKIKDVQKINKLLDFHLEELTINYIQRKSSTNYSVIIKNIILNQNIIKNSEYDKLLITKNSKDNEKIILEYNINKDESKNIIINEIKMYIEMQIYLILNIYIIKYINYNILSCFSNNISFVEMSGYIEDNVSKYLQLGYIINEYNKEQKRIKLNKNYKTKYKYDINLKTPIIIIPQDIVDSKNTKCIVISAEELTVKSELINENNNNILFNEDNKGNDNENNSDYESCLNDSNILESIYDKQTLLINGIQLYLSNSCAQEENYKINENILVHYFNLFISYKTLDDLNKNNIYNNNILTINIKDLYFSIDEFQIIFLLNYLKEMKFQDELLNQNIEKNDINKNEIMNKYNKECQIKFIKKLEMEGILSKNEFILENNININRIKTLNKIIDEKMFYENPNNFFFEVKINEIKLVIYKIYPDLTKAIFIQLKLSKIELIKLNNYFDDSLMKLNLKSITLIDKEQDIKKNYLLPKEFQLLIKNNNQNINCITYSNLYINEKNENISNIEINNIDILSSFNSLTRIYIFSMYYLGKYQDIQYNEANNKNINVYKANIQRDTRYKNNNSIIKEEKIFNQNILKFKLKNSNFRIPYNEKDIKKPIFSIKLNMFYEQSNNLEKQNIYDINKKQLLKTKLIYNNKNMNLMIFESDFDIIYLNPSYIDIKKEKIISNYRIQYTSKYTYFLSKKISKSTMRILVEPLIITIDLYQLKYSLNFYNDMMKFLFESLYQNYVPYLKPEDIIYINGKSIIIERKKNLVKIIKKIIKLNKMKKKAYMLFENKKKKGNRNSFLTNSFNSISFQLDKIYITILDSNNMKEKRILLALQLSKLLFNKMNNSNPKDKTNVSNELLSIISNSKINIEDYIIHNLYKYMNCKLTLELYYYNLEYSDFEPIIEPLNLDYLSYQVDEIFRNKTFITIDNIININVSTNCMKVLNIFMHNYMKNENQIEKKNEINIYNKKRNNYSSLLSKNSKNIEEQEEIVIKLSNHTGLFIYFWFDFDKDNKIKIDNNETINLTDKLIYKTRKNKKIIQKKGIDNSTFSFRILKYECIQKINFNKTNNLYFKTKINDNESNPKFLYYNIKINTTSLIKEITFESSISILNETIFDELLISIDDNYIQENEIILSKNKIAHIPLTWIISSKNIFLQKNKNSEKLLIYKDISEITSSGKLTSSELNEKEKQIEKTKAFLEKKLNKKINLHHPKYKNYIVTFALQKFNLKNSKIVNIKNEKNENISLFLDYCSLTSKDNEITGENDIKKDRNNNEDKIFQYLEYTSNSLEYIILIRPIITFTNYTPFEISILNNQENSNSNNLIINKMKSVEIYDKWSSEISNNSLDSSIKIQIIYNKEIYETDYININNNNYINTLYFSNKDNKILRCNISHNLLAKSFNIFEQDLEQYSFLSYNYIFFFDYIINNRIGFDLYSIELKDINNFQNNIHKFNNESLSVLSCNKEDIQYILISSNENDFNDKIKVNVNVINLENNIEIEKDKIIYNMLCKVSNSINYIYTNILLFEPKYILVNDLDFNIYFQQINENNKPLDEIKKVISKKYISLSYKREKKIIFKIGVKVNKRSEMISFSGLFELDNLMEYDLKVEVDATYKSKYSKNIFQMANKIYLYFRVKNKITDEGNVYLFITLPEFPIFEIDNRTSEKIIIYETKKDEPLIISPMSKIPFIWKNNVLLKNNFMCEISNKKKVLSFSSYEKITMKIKKNIKIHIYNHQKNTLTGTRCITFEEESLLNKSKQTNDVNENKNYLELLFDKKNLKSLSKINIFIKGIGLSFLDECPKEIFYISFYEIRLIYSNSFLPSIKRAKENNENFLFYLKNLQIDSSLNNSIKTLIYPKNQNIPSLEGENSNSYDDDTVNFISLSVVKRSTKNITKEVKSVKYPVIDLCIQEINIKLDQVIIMNLISLLNSYLSKLDYFKTTNNNKNDIIEEDKLLKNIKIPLEELKYEKHNSKKILINYLFLSAIKINLTFRLDLSNLNISHLPKIISRIIASLGSSLVRISDSPIKYKEKIIQNIYMEFNEISNLILKSFIKETKIQIIKILGSSDIIGNPVNLIEKIGTGFFEFVNEPRKGLLKGPSQFGKGVAKGVAGLLNGVVGGTLDSVSKITGTLYTLLQSLTGKNNELIMEEDSEPTNIITGASEGLKNGFQELYSGFAGLIFNPIERTSNSNSNPIKFFKDLGLGLVGFAVSPVNFILKIGNSLAVGTKNTFNYFYNKSIKNQRFRFPRYIPQNNKLAIYDPDLSAAKEFLYKLLKIENPIILYFSQFLCENKGYSGNIAYFLLTEEQLLLLSNNYNIILNINTIEIKDIKLNYNGINFQLIFDLNDDKMKVLIINKSSSVFACELYCVLENKLNIMKSKVNRSISFTKPISIKFTKALKKKVENRKLKLIEKNYINDDDNIIENNNSLFFVNGKDISEDEE